MSPETFSRVREVLSGKARPRKQKHEFAFSALLPCAYDNCAVTAEVKKQQHTYYRCTGYRGKAPLTEMGVDEIYFGKQMKLISVVSNFETGEPLWFGQD